MSEEKKNEILEQEKELNKDELEAVAGGDACGCAVGGYGDEGGGDSQSCICMFGGCGYGWGKEARCACPMVGGGTSSGD